MANEAYGTSGDGMFGMVQILPDSRLRVVTPYTDMGNGAATTLKLAPSEFLGQNAQTIAMSEIGPFNALDSRVRATRRPIRRRCATRTVRRAPVSAHSISTTR